MLNVWDYRLLHCSLSQLLLMLCPFPDPLYGYEKSGSGILVLPTGAGKTFTAVRWLSDHIIPKNIKTLWLTLKYAIASRCVPSHFEFS